MAETGNLCFVQFLHPGVEHRPENGGKKAWNRGIHRRKFLLTDGRALNGGEEAEGELVFWGEWEPESEVIQTYQAFRKGEPERLWHPYFVVPQSYDGQQNTDPFIFESFLYGICQEFRKTGPTKLRYLSRGSVILFGSCLADEFVLDTVFVVRDFIDHRLETYVSALTGRVPDEYLAVSIKPLYASDGKAQDVCAPNTAQCWRLYIGATFESPVEGMYSFFPCLPRVRAKTGFPRPAIRDPGIVTASAKQGFRLNPQVSVRDCQSLWQSVVAQVSAEGLWLGIHAGMPDRRNPSA